MGSYRRRGRYIDPNNSGSRSRVSFKSGQTYVVGSDLGSAMAGVGSSRHDGNRELLAELEQQKRERQGK